ncbi:hypothetical protein O1L60_44575 [Streptomyces diastatochromogenes]|nr:hypothetical protein [Streptomyces diastatochromogenes]
MPTLTARDLAETALLEHLITGTLDDRDRTTNLAVTVLNSAGTCACCSESVGWTALAVADHILAALTDALTGDRHHIVCTFEDGDDVLAAPLHLARVCGALAASAEDTVRFLLTLAAGVCQGRSGLTVRSSKVGAVDEVRAWSLGHGAITPLNRAQTFAAYCTDAATGEPIPPQPDTEYCDAFPLS